ncbi:methyl-accepting chemotaxis protein [Falsiroseomonas sp.]|uniref:methyl-accepting chemotaxis protein n=1 Tax=Falsiroseomonas sp. TaxID=2870721 RepID=UPI003F6F9989
MHRLRSIQARLVLAFMAVAGAVAALVLTISLMQQRATQEVVTELSAQRIGRTTQEIFEMELTRLETLGRSITADPRLVEAVARSEQAGMATVLAPIHAALTAERLLTNIAVMTPPALLHYRSLSHTPQPENIAARRPDIVMATREGRAVAGLASGATGLTAAAIVPVLREGRTLGAVSVQANIGPDLLGRIAETVNAQIVIHAMQGDRMVRISGTRPEGLGSAAMLRAGLARATPPEMLRDGARSYMVMAVPLVDFAGQPVATAELLLDQTAQVARAEADQWMLLGAIGLALLASAVASLLLARGIARPIRGLIARTEALAGGEAEQPVPGTARGDEIGVMARALEVLRSNSQRQRRQEAELAEAREAARVERQKMRDTLVQGFEASLGGIAGALAKAAGGLTGAADSMAEAVTETRRESGVAQEAGGSASRNAASAAAATEELSSSIAEIARQMSQTTQVTRRAREEATGTARQVEALNEAASRIGDVVRLITDIAGQTNLLALNATIEAARAGEAGKGFAVVASEVKQLAAQTATATQEISQKIEEMRQAAAGNAEAVARIGQTIAQLDEIAASIAAAVEQQGSATAEIARNVAQAAASTEAVAGAISAVEQRAEGAGDAAEMVREASGQVAAQSSGLRREMERFVTQLRAA